MAGLLDQTLHDLRMKRLDRTPSGGLLGNIAPVEVPPMIGGGSMEVEPTPWFGTPESAEMRNSLFSGVGGMGVPLLSDAAGLYADLDNMYRKPEERTWLNAGLAGLGALPFLPGGMTVWHGSPHWFDKFDSSKIGSGEGAQAYGHGLYLAESPGVARHYAPEISGTPESAAAVNDYANKFAGEGTPYSDDAAEEWGALYIGAEPDGSILAFAPDGTDRVVRERVNGDVEHVFAPVSNFYEVDLPDEHIDRMLDWDAPLSEQPEGVRGLLAPIVDELVASPINDTSRRALTEGTATGRDLYFSAGGHRMFGPDAAAEPGPAASEWLKSTGVPGIKYYDGGSRAAGEGTRNFVVFDDSLPKILKRNDEPVGGLLGELPMDEASRMARAREQGFTQDLYHGTSSPGFESFEPGDIGTHAGTYEQANQRLLDVEKARSGRSMGRGAFGDNANVIPLKANIGKSLEMPDVGLWNDSEKVLAALEDIPGFSGRLDDAWEELGVPDQFGDSSEWLKSPENMEMLDEIRGLLQTSGYDSVRYANQVENKYGNLSGLSIRGEKEAAALNARYHDLVRAPARRRPSLPDNATEAQVQAWLDAPEPKHTAAEAKELEDVTRALQEVRERETMDNSSYIILDPANIRSRFAKFDPANIGKNDMLGNVSPGLLGAMAAGGGLGAAAYSGADNAAQWLGGLLDDREQRRQEMAR